MNAEEAVPESRVPTQPPAHQSPYDTTTQTLLDIVQQLALELHPHKHDSLAVTLDSALERDLGFDSLGRMELLLRLERALGVRLSEQALATAESPRDLLHAVQGASAVTPSGMATAVDSTMLETPDGVPVSATTLVAVLDWHARVHPQRLHIALYNADE